MNLKKIYFATALAALVLTVVIYILFQLFPLLELIDSRGRDIYFRIEHALSAKPKEADQITILSLDDETLKQLKTRWPYPRSIYAEVLKKLKPHQPKAVGFDLVFSGNDYAPESDAALALAMKESGNVVIASYHTTDSNVDPLPLIQDSAWRVGRVDKVRDPDFALRRSRLVRSYEGKNFNSWEFEIFRKAFPDSNTSEFPLMQSIPIHYHLDFSEINRISFWQLIDGIFDPKLIHGKIILLGLTAAAFHDSHFTPFGSMPGVAVNANVILMLMRGDFFSFAPESARWLLYFLSFWGALLTAMFSSVLVGLITVVFLSLIYAAVGYLLFSTQLIFDPWLLISGMVLVYLGAMIYRQAALLIENIRLQEESSRDALTGFYNRRFLTLKLKSEFGRLISRQGVFNTHKEIAVVMIDLDNFKHVNDNFGHAEGDKVLHTMAAAIRSSVRKNELICRFGGDEFCVILPSMTLQDAIKFAEKIRSLIYSNPDLSYKTKDGSKTIQVTGSIGVASVTGKSAMDHNKLLKAADRALYRAKAGGRNQVCVYDPAQDVLE